MNSRIRVQVDSRFAVGIICCIVSDKDFSKKIRDKFIKHAINRKLISNAFDPRFEYREAWALEEDLFEFIIKWDDVTIGKAFSQLINVLDKNGEKVYEFPLNMCER